jgi:hypothetical protein
MGAPDVDTRRSSSLTTLGYGGGGRGTLSPVSIGPKGPGVVAVTVDVANVVVDSVDDDEDVDSGECAAPRIQLLLCSPDGNPVWNTVSPSPGAFCSVPPSGNGSSSYEPSVDVDEGLGAEVVDDEVVNDVVEDDVEVVFTEDDVENDSVKFGQFE